MTGHLDSADGALRQRFFDALVSEFPPARGYFPPGTSTAPRPLVDALSWLLRNTPAGPGHPVLPPAVARRLHAFALDFRRFGFSPDAYGIFADVAGRALADTLAGTVDGAELSAAVRIVAAAAAEMAGEAGAADLAGIPAATAARIDSVSRRGGVAVVRLEAGLPLGYSPGQCVPVMLVGQSGRWASLAPAIPANPFGQLEFHVDGEFEPEVGEYVTIGAARGPAVHFSAGDAVLAVAAGTGAAAVKALVFGWLEQDGRPDTHVLLAEPGPEGAGDAVYDAAALEAVARRHSWLRVTRGPLDPGSAPGLVAGRSAVVCGASESVRPLASTLRDAGAREIVELAPDAPSRWG